ncbi:MAG: GNAT family N-acetyltransferase [Acidimicrobiales bacterium]
MALVDHWPLFGLRVTTPRLELRSPTDDDLDHLLDVARRGVHDPGFMPFTTPWTDTPSPAFEREALRYWWGNRAGWSPDDWRLDLAVVVDGRPVGVQGLAATGFPRLRTAETGSWLGLEHQGRGLGREMRAAMLHLAFEQLGAVAVTVTGFDACRPLFGLDPSSADGATGAPDGGVAAEPEPVGG